MFQLNSVNTLNSELPTVLDSAEDLTDFQGK